MAGFFGFFDYSRPGKGVDKDAPQKPRFFLFFALFFRKFWKMIQLNMLMVITSIPLLFLMLLFAPMPTVDGDVAGSLVLSFYQIGCLMYLSVVGFGLIMPGVVYVLRNYANERHAWVWSDFWDHIRRNWKQSLLLTLIDTVAVAVIYINLHFYTQIGDAMIYVIARAMLCAFAAVYFMMHFYLYQMMVTFDLKLRALMKNAFIFTLAKLPMNLIILILLFLLSFAAVLYPGVTLLLFVLILPVFMNFIVTFYAQRNIRIYMMPPDEEEVQRLEEEGLL